MLALLLCACMLTACDTVEPIETEAPTAAPIPTQAPTEAPTEAPTTPTDEDEEDKFIKVPLEYLEDIDIDKSKLSTQEIPFKVNYTKVTSFYVIPECTEVANYTYLMTDEESARLCEILNNAKWIYTDVPKEAIGKSNFIFYVKTDNSDIPDVWEGEYYFSGIFRDFTNHCIAVLNSEERADFEEIMFAAHEREPRRESMFFKPVIYLYPTTDTVCSVNLEVSGGLSCTYPAYGKDGWQNFTARPDGTLIFPDGREYYCLYWEGRSQSFENDFSKGFCVKGSDSAEFLNSALLQLGLTPREANEFIIYWLPKLEANEYNLLSFQFDNYTNSAPLEITPTPDSVLRVFLAMKPLDEYVEIEPQELPSFERKGFTVVEWGGTWVE